MLASIEASANRFNLMPLSSREDSIYYFQSFQAQLWSTTNCEPPCLAAHQCISKSKLYTSLKLTHESRVSSCLTCFTRRRSHLTRSWLDRASIIRVLSQFPFLSRIV